MESKDIRRIFYRDGYRHAHGHLDQERSSDHLIQAIRELYQLVDKLLESFLRRTASEGTPAECKKACAWCCYQAVFAVTHEFFFLQHFVQNHFNAAQKERILERARDKAKRTLNLPAEEQLKLRAPCPFLEEDSCMVYPARPMACRIYLSSSVSSCKRDFHRPSGGKNIPELYEFPLLAGRMLNEGFVAFLKQNGVRSSELPLEQGYSSMVSLGQSMEDWIA